MKWTALVPLAVVLSGCASAVQHPAVTRSDQVLALGDGIQLSLTGTVSRSDSPDPRCADSVYELHTAAGDFEAYALDTRCVPTDGTPENGNHGFYPVPPAGAPTDQVTTPVGPATVFSNQYADCTSSCYLGTDEVALVGLGGHVVQVVAVTAPASGTTARDRTGLVAVLQGLRHA